MVGAGSIVIGVKGMAGIVDEGRVTELPGVDRVIRITEKYKDASRNFHHEDTIIDVNGTLVGGANLTIFGGPCAIESEEQAVESAVMARDAGVDILRAFVDKSRTSPYDYRGLEISRGLEIVKAMKAATGLPVVCELIDLRHLDAFLEAGIDVVQIGRRIAQIAPPRSLSAPHTRSAQHGFGNGPERSGSAPPLHQSGSQRRAPHTAREPKRVLCYRGIRYSSPNRFAADISMIPVVRVSHLPLIADPPTAPATAGSSSASPTGSWPRGRTASNSTFIATPRRPSATVAKPCARKQGASSPVRARYTLSSPKTASPVASRPQLPSRNSRRPPTLCS